MIVFSHHSDNIITRSNTWTLEQMATATDKYLFEKMDYLCYTYFNTNSGNALIKELFKYERYVIRRNENYATGDFRY